ncbi:MAG: SrtB family sortase, partial [Lachnospiraceae bacterium]|nr:SrtB family sortase [Lachnospiraceae bacterium]
MAGFEVAGRRFRTEADYRAALRDQAKINRIRAQVNMEQPGEVITLYSDMQSGKYRFETAVGNDFDDEIYELAQEFKRQGYNRDSRLTIEKEKKGRFSGWKAGRSADKSGEAARKDGKTVR